MLVCVFRSTCTVQSRGSIIVKLLSTANVTWLICAAEAPDVGPGGLIEARSVVLLVVVIDVNSPAPHIYFLGTASARPLARLSRWPPACARASSHLLFWILVCVTADMGSYEEKITEFLCVAVGLLGWSQQAPITKAALQI